MPVLKPLPYKLSRQFKRFLGRKLTICIAASAESGKYLVCAADTMVANELATTDPLVAKIHVVGDWAVLLSGTLGQADALMDSLTREILSGSDNEPKTIRSYLEKVHREEMGAWSAGRWLAPFGLDMQTFLSKGSTFPQQLQSDLSRSIAFGAENYDAEIIVCGWGSTIRRLARAGKSNPQAYIFSADHSGIQLHKTTGLYACGSGSPAAMSTLYFHDCGSRLSLPTVVYLVATAKFMAEKTLGVGPNTVMFVMKRTGGLIPIHAPQLNLIHKEWQDKGAPRIPATAVKVITNILADHDKDG